MSKINDGGSAFPCEQGHTPEGTWNQSFEPGMTLRDYFAAKAMQAIVAAKASIHDIDIHQKAQADWAYQIADAMLEARQK